MKEETNIKSGQSPVSFNRKGHWSTLPQANHIIWNELLTYLQKRNLTSLAELLECWKTVSVRAADWVGNVSEWAEEVAQKLRASSPLPEAPSSAPSTHAMWPQLQETQHPILAYLGTDMQTHK